MKDLTKGRPSVLILTFALPIFLANLLQLTYSLADTRIVGTFLGDNALAAVGATTTLSNLIVQFLMGMALLLFRHSASERRIWTDCADLWAILWCLAYWQLWY
mgnify:CR=1 FL=1